MQNQDVIERLAATRDDLTGTEQFVLVVVGLSPIAWAPIFLFHAAPRVALALALLPLGLLCLVRRARERDAASIVAFVLIGTALVSSCLSPAPLNSLMGSLDWWTGTLGLATAIAWWAIGPRTQPSGASARDPAPDRGSALECVDRVGAGHVRHQGRHACRGPGPRVRHDAEPGLLRGVPFGGSRLLAHVVDAITAFGDPGLDALDRCRLERWANCGGDTFGRRSRSAGRPSRAVDCVTRRGTGVRRHLRCGVGGLDQQRGRGRDGASRLRQRREARTSGEYHSTQ